MLYCNPQVTVVIGDNLKNVSLRDLPADLWPRPSAVNQLATEAAKQKKKGATTPFVYADVKKFVPEWATGAEGYQGESGSDEDARATRKRTKNTLPMLQWVAAYDSYAVAAAIAGQWNYAASFAHKAVCLQIANDAKTYGRHPAVAVVYDELVRKRLDDNNNNNNNNNFVGRFVRPFFACCFVVHFRFVLQDRACKNAPGFDPNRNTHVVDEVLLKQAEKAYAERGEQLRSSGWRKDDQWGNNNWRKDEGDKGSKRTFPWQGEHPTGAAALAKKQRSGEILSTKNTFVIILYNDCIQVSAGKRVGYQAGPMYKIATRPRVWSATAVVPYGGQQVWPRNR